ncbi:efflux RND transporter periplasmic adaptor subunit [Novosphingobium sp. Gsoil 351]|uniref:efflux RND transporter periplasmic adaptor subunit n=1 Tax=Novosphingobium sp. Gsoil 351 TaxID=2675225 RepID=UPI0012B49FFA|nr:efflux RND transporter periplasmic adaptor subunit [Novosphingobium sp. Gsoil 351]QGN55903.1 efflux RND transporter periplasmic adaptor subunit [Novosphingobium sp. Gsoil 351]
MLALTSSLPRHGRPSPKRVLTLIFPLAVLAACSAPAQDGKRGDKGPLQVGYRVVQPAAVPLETELAGRVAASRSAEVRPQVTGVIQRRLFAEGSYVRQGQPLFQIDPSLYRAATAQAEANLASAQASASAAQTKAARYAPLASEQAVSQQEYTDVAASARVGRAVVAQNRAALNTARINLRFTTVPAPISGRIGRSAFTEGALVTSAQSDPLATIAVLDPVYVDIQESAADLVALRRRMGGNGAAPMTAEVRLLLDDGSEYGFAGKLRFSEITVDPATGSVTLRAEFPNPQGLLLPGMFVRAKFAQTVLSDAYLVPQTALSRDPSGNARVYVLGAGNRAMQRAVTATRTVGANWVVTAGLKPGERVLTQGLGKVKQGQPVKPVPESAPQTPGRRPAKQTKN